MQSVFGFTRHNFDYPGTDSNLISLAPMGIFSMPLWNLLSEKHTLMPKLFVPGVNMSLLSKAMSPRLSRGVFNCGLLSTEAGTLARALADGMITIAGKAGVENVLNYTMIPTFFIVVFTTGYTLIGYYSLY